MDPVSAVGFAASIITFVDFSCKLVQGSYEIYQSHSGIPHSHAHIDTVLADLNNVTESLKAPVRTDTHHHVALRSLASECEEVSAELSSILNDLKRKEGNKVWRSLEAKWKSIRKESDIASIERKLNSLRLQLLIRLSLLVSEEQSIIKSTLVSVKEEGIIPSQRTEKLEGIHSAMKTLGKDLQTAVAKQEAVQVDALADMCVKLSSLTVNVEKALETRSHEEKILKRLRFASMFSRSEEIAEAGFSTFDWMVKAQELPERENDAQHHERVMRQQARRSFMSWIETGNQIYHISGKAGSGKSTLMKFLCNRIRPHPASNASEDGDGSDAKQRALSSKLSLWAGDKKLVVATFFFWNSGDADQRSLRGLYQSILFEILRQCPELIKEAFPGQCDQMQENFLMSDEEPFRISELKRALSSTLSNSTFPNHRFCFFIDGLDEFETDMQTDHWDLARMLRTWAMSPDVKICVSSRPHEEFLQCFDPQLRLHLHEMTRVDVEKYVYGVINQEDAGLVKDPKFSDLVQTVIDGADGVFLWVCIVTRSLVDGIRRRYSPEALMQRLSKVPRNIEQLFDSLFDDIDPGDRERSDKMLLLSALYDIPHAIMYSWIDDLDDPDFPFTAPITAYSDDEIRARHETVRRQLDSLSKGLLEMQTAPFRFDGEDSKMTEDIYFHHPVSFLHRTVKDYLNDPKRLHVVRGRLGDQFDVLQSLQRLRLAVFKFARTMPPYFEPEGLRQSGLATVLTAMTKEASFQYSSRFLEECERVLEHHRITPFTYPGVTEDNPQVIAWSVGIVTGRSFETQINENISFQLWLASEAVANMHITDWLLSNLHSAGTNGGGILLFKAAYFRQLALMRRLMEQGISPGCSIIVRRGFTSKLVIDIEEPSIHATTVWESFLFVMAARLLSVYSFAFLHHSLGLLLEFGANGNAYFVLKGRPRPNSASTSDKELESNTVDAGSTPKEQLTNESRKKLFKLSLEEFVLLWHPPNLDALIRHITECKRSSLLEGTLRAVGTLGTAISSWSGAPKNQSTTYASLAADSLKSLEGKYTVESVHVGNKCLERGALIKII